MAHTSLAKAVASLAVIAVGFSGGGACGGQTDGNEQASGAAGAGQSGAPGGGGSGGSLDGGKGGSSGDSGSNGFGCFAEGTRILTPGGSIAIERLVVGDRVLAYDEPAGRVVERPVTALHAHPDRVAGRLELADGRALVVTPEHPVYLPDQRRYVAAGALHGEARLLGVSAAHSTASVIGSGYARAPSAAPITVYNITVAGEENYFAEGVLVHNKSGAGPVGPCPPAPPSWSSEACSSMPGCHDLAAPSSELVPMNAPAEGGDGAVVTELEALVCGLDAGSAPVFIAFDAFSSAAAPSFELYTGDLPCSGTQLGEIWLFDYDPPPVGVWTTQCAQVESTRLQTRIAVVARSPDARVDNLRLVSGCSCPRQLKEWTTCGIDATGYGGGSACL
jgi:hypothetical protein